MTEQDRIIDAIKNRKPTLKIAGKYSNMDVDRMLKAVISKNNFRVTYTTKRVANAMLESVLVTFTYLEPVKEVKPPVTPTVAPTVKPSPTVAPTITPRSEPSVDPTIKPFSGRDSFNEREVTSIDKRYEITASTTLSFIPEIDINKGNVCDIRCINPSKMIDILRENHEEIAANNEGVGTARYYTCTLGRETIVRFRHYVGMPYEEVSRMLKEGQEKAKEVINMLTGGNNLRPEITMMLAFAYIQKEVEYNSKYIEEVFARGDGFADVVNHMAYGTLVKHLAVCEGYSWAFIHMMKAVGIEAVAVDGTHDGVQHEWVKVRLGGSWYNLEITIRNKQKGYAVFSNFLVSDEYLRRNGYVFKDYRPVANDKRYEDFGTLSSLIDRYRDEYIRKGASRKYLMLNYVKSI